MTECKFCGEPFDAERFHEDCGADFGPARFYDPLLASLLVGIIILVELGAEVLRALAAKVRA